MGIVMNTAIDATDSHIAQMVIEGSTMSITEAVKLRNQYRDRPGCGELVTLANDIAEFEDIANAAWYFGSEQSRNTTGTELVVDGGMLAQLTPNINRTLWG